MANKRRPVLLLPLMLACCLLSLLIQTLLGDGMPNPLKKHLEYPYENCYEDYELKEANCWRKWFDWVPQWLSEDTEILNLNDNIITALLNSSFERYPLIRELLLFNNGIKMIESGTFYPLKELTVLDLAENHRLVFPDTYIFRWNRKLSTLDLTGLKMSWIPSDILKGISSLDTLSVSHNNLSSINISSCGTVRRADFSSNSFSHLEAETFNFACHTETLVLGDNFFKTVDPQVIASLHVRSLVLGEAIWIEEALRNILIGISLCDIEKLVIRNNFYYDWSIPKGFFDPLRGHFMSIIDLSNNTLSDLYPFVFSNLTQVGELLLSHNEIETIEPNFFDGMQELRVLRVNDNRLRYINADNHTWTLDLIELDLSHNKIENIEPNFFYGMHELRVLRVNDNLLRSINTYNHTWTLDLTELDLSHNDLLVISKFTFIGLENITILDLSSNKYLQKFEFASSSRLHNIQSIDLSGSDIYRLKPFRTPNLKSLTMNMMNMMRSWAILLNPRETFAGLQSLEYLYIRNSRLHSDDVWDASSLSSVFDGLFHLTILDLSDNHRVTHYGEFPPWIFRQLSALQELNLDNCKIETLHPLLFATLVSLKKLSLKGNMIERLHPDLLIGSRHLTSIDLKQNSLIYLDEEIFSNNKMLTNISLAENKLTLFNKSTFTPVSSSLSFLNLSRNPIVCNCDLKWLLILLRGPIDLIDEEFTVCSFASIEPLREKPLRDFNVDILCRRNILPVCLIPIALVCLAVIVVLVYHNRWPLKYKLFLLKLAAIGYKEIQDARDHNDYEFDVNIIFYDDDEEWVREHLRPALEEHLPQFQRNVIGDEDLVLGMHYLESVDYVVSHSYKTIILLSRAAVRDRWFMLKFRIAMDHVSDTQTEFVAVVFLEDIPDDEIPFLARLYLSDGRPYIYWTEDVRAHEYFWNQLVKTLTINLRTNDLIPNE